MLSALVYIFFEVAQYVYYRGIYAVPFLAAEWS